MQSDQQVPEPAERGAVIPIVRARLGQELREYYPEVVFLEIDSRLGRVVERLSGALDAAEAEGQVRAGFKDALIGALPRLRRYALALTHPELAQADDLVQTALLRAWEHRRGLPPGGSLVAWLFTVLRAAFVDGRRGGRPEALGGAATPAGSPGQEAGQEAGPDPRDLRTALDRLDPAQREALLLIVVEGLSYESAAAIIGCPPGTVKSRVSRARERLAAELGRA